MSGTESSRPDRSNLFTGRTLSRRDFLKIAGIGVAGAAMGASVLGACGSKSSESGGASPSAADMEVLKFGYTGPLTGAAVGWGLPATEGLKIWQDQINAAGGVKAGGKVYKMELVAFDTELNGGKALSGARKMVLQDKVAFICDCGGSCVTAMAPFVTEQKVPLFTRCCADTKADRPTVFSVSDDFPIYMPYSADFICDKWPDVKRVAILSQDEEIGLTGIAWHQAAFEARGKEVVYNKPFATDTTDFAPLMTAVLDEKPDVLSMGASWPSFQALMLEQAYQRGWEGIIASACWQLDPIMAKVSKPFMTNAVCHFPDFDDAQLSGAPHNDPSHMPFWDEWVKRYGDKSIFSDVTWTSAADADVWLQGVALADSVEPEAVMEALASASQLEHAFGVGKWWGDAIYGTDRTLVPDTWPLTQVIEGKTTITSWSKGNVQEWCDRGDNWAVLEKTLAEYGFPVVG